MLWRFFTFLEYATIVGRKYIAMTIKSIIKYPICLFYF